MNRLPGADELSSGEYSSLLLVAPGFISRSAIPKAHQDRLAQLGLIHKALGGLMPTPAGSMVARIKIGR